jgi:hypothetical protein
MHAHVNSYVYTRVSYRNVISYTTDMGHRRRLIGLESRLQQELQQFLSKCAKELVETKDKHKREYDMLIEETAQRAYGGVSSCQCRRKYLCRHNKTAR